MDTIILVFQLAILLMSVVVHEFSHGWIAYSLGDSTAKRAGRLTLNPLKHLDFFGSLIIPLVLFIFSGGQAIFGWAKPVPFNPSNLRDQRWGSAKVAAAGPAANFLVAIVFGLMLRFLPDGILSSFSGLAQILELIVFLNILLAVFNLIPVPPLDGSKILFSFLPNSFIGIMEFLEQYSMFILLLIVFFGFQIILPLVFLIFSLIVGS